MVVLEKPLTLKWYMTINSCKELFSNTLKSSGNVFYSAHGNEECLPEC